MDFLIRQYALMAVVFTYVWKLLLDRFLYASSLINQSRVAPTKRQSVPKLKLCGAQILAKWYSKIKNIFPTGFSLAQAALCNFIHFCCQQGIINAGLTSGCVWRHVPTYFNPADIVSRGSSVKEFSSSIRFTGSEFLALEPAQWPSDRTEKLSLENQ